MSLGQLVRRTVISDAPGNLITSSDDGAGKQCLDVNVALDDSGAKDVILTGIVMEGSPIHDTVSVPTATPTTLIPGPGLLKRKSFLIHNADCDLYVTLDGSTPSASNGLHLEPGDVLATDPGDFITQDVIQGFQVSGSSKDVTLIYVEGA